MFEVFYILDSGVLKPGHLVRLVSVNYALSENIPPALVPYCATGSTAKEGTGDEMSLTRNGMALGKCFNCSFYVA